MIGVLDPFPFGDAILGSESNVEHFVLESHFVHGGDGIFGMLDRFISDVSVCEAVFPLVQLEEADGTEFSEHRSDFGFSNLRLRTEYIGGEEASVDFF